MKRNKHNLSHYKLFSCDMGELVPIGITEVLPGDTLQHATSALVRCAPLLSPVMHPVNVKIHHWYVPFRLIWNEFEDLITAGPDGTSIPTFPTIANTGPVVGIGTLADYLGVPTSLGAGTTISALPFRAYNLIWNEWYRDQDLQPELAISLASGPDSSTAFILQNVAWEKDYFTSSRPWEQKGPTVTVPLGTKANVRANDTDLVTGAGPGMNLRRGDGSAIGTNLVIGTSGAGPSSAAGVSSSVSSGTTVPVYPSNLYADLTNASAVTVNTLRQALALQRFEEARARYGSRYTEYLRYLGVKSSDSRLQRPEYLGGGKQTIQFSEVLATAETGTTVKVGDLKGHGIAAMRSNRYRRFFEEHGYVVSLLSVQPRTMYVQGLPRHWSRRTKEAFWQKEFEHIGQQPVALKEVYAPSATPDAIFGYQDRYDEYRREESSVAGLFRTTLNTWHLSREFGSPPALNSTFVQSVPSPRIFADTSSDNLYAMVNHSIQARRLVAREGTSMTF